MFFIGNSYTAQNNLPQLISEIAGSTGDYLNYQSYTPGGSTLQDHANDNAVLNTINQGNWDYVVLQEQSQIPAFSTSFVQTEFFPFATQLANNIKSRNACGNPVFYMTWGRKTEIHQTVPQSLTFALTKAWMTRFTSATCRLRWKPRALYHR